MECPKDCPVLVGYAKTIEDLHADAVIMRSLLRQNEQLEEQNRATAKSLAALPSTPDVSEARGFLQEAIIQVGVAQVQLTESINMSNIAIDANQTASDVILGNCPGEPTYIEDPSRPGSMILACSSPGMFEN